MESSATPASPSGDFHKLRAEFASLNPDLREEPSHYHCRGLWHLLTPRHRHGLPSCYPGSAQPWESDCFLSNAEVWQDTVTGLPVMVLHLDCKHHYGAPTHAQSLNVLAERGLWYATSNSSWVLKRARLVVIARADVIEGISLPNHPDNYAYIAEFGTEFKIDPSEFPRTPLPEIHWKASEALRLSEEQMDISLKYLPGYAAESRGDYQAALQFYCETAYIHRTGGFHESAQQQLDRAKGIIEAHPELEVEMLRFENVADHNHVFYNSRTMVSRSHLEQRLRTIPLPAGWQPFVARASWHAWAQISGQGRSGYAIIDQGGWQYLWKAKVVLNDGLAISTVAGEEPQSLFGEENYCCDSPEAAVAAAIMIYHNYGRLLIKEGIPLAEVLQISGLPVENQSSD